MKRLIYYPLQPDYERQAGYKSHVVKKGEPLYGIVQIYYEFQNTMPQEELCLKALPDAIIDVVFKYYQDELDCIIGAGTGKYYEVKYRKVQKIFGFQLAPGAVNLLFPFNGQNVIEAGRIELNNDYSFIESIRESLKASESFEERIAVVSYILSEMVSERLAVYETIQSSVYEMVNHLSEYKIEDVAREVGYSYRYFRKMFKENVGYSPQKFMRIIRFQKSYEAIINRGNKH